MYKVIRSVIASGGYKLADVQYRIKKLYSMGDLNEAQMDELMALAVLGASANSERPETLELIQTLADKITALEARVAALESGAEDSGTDTSYPEWKAWDGISTDYQSGAIVSHNGELWRSIFAGQNVWEPGVIGTENLWERYTEDAATGDVTDNTVGDTFA